MAACMRNMTFTSSSLAKWASLKSSCGHKQIYFILPKRHLSVLTEQQQHSSSKKCRSHKLYRCNKQWGALLAARHASTDAANIPPGYIPDNPLAPGEDIEAILPELNALGEPTLTSIGLGGYSPAGLVQSFLETIHVSLDLPWWGAIVVCSLTLRTLIFPLMLKQRKNAIRMRNHMPTFTRLNQKAKDAKDVGNQELYMRRSSELTKYMERNNISFKTMFLLPVVQIPIFLSVYQAIRKMSLLPVESMKTGGIFWFTDLTVVDPTYLLPAAASLSILAMFELGAEAQRAQDMGHIAKWAMRSMPLLVFFFTSKFASGIAFYWTVNNFISLLTALLLRQQGVKNFFGIPEEVQHKKEAKQNKGFLEGFQDAYESSKLSAELQQRRQLDDRSFKEAGVGPVPKTYSYDPTKKNMQKLQQRLASK